MSIHLLTADVRTALNAGSLYSALSLAITLPDICGKADEPAERSQKRFAKWWDANMDSWYFCRGRFGLSGDNAYAFRCAFLHEGSDQVGEQSASKLFDRFVFVSNENQHLNAQMLGERGEPTTWILQLSVPILAKDIADAVDRWAVARQSDPAAQTRIDAMMQIYAGYGFSNWT